MIKEKLLRAAKRLYDSGKLETVIITVLVVVLVVGMLIGRHYNFVVDRDVSKTTESAEVLGYQDYIIQS